MLIRMFEYDTQIAQDGSEVRDDVLEVRFPHSGGAVSARERDTEESINRNCTYTGRQSIL